MGISSILGSVANVQGISSQLAIPFHRCHSSFLPERALPNSKPKGVASVWSFWGAVRHQVPFLRFGGRRYGYLPNELCWWENGCVLVIPLALVDIQGSR